MLKDFNLFVCNILNNGPTRVWCNIHCFLIGTQNIILKTSDNLPCMNIQKVYVNMCCKCNLHKLTNKYTGVFFIDLLIKGKIIQIPGIDHQLVYTLMNDKIDNGNGEYMF